MNFPAFLWLILVPLLASPLVYLIGRLTRQTRYWWISCLAAVLALVASWIPFISSAVQLTGGATLEYTLGSISLKMDGLSLLLAAVVLGEILCHADFNDQRHHRPRLCNGPF
jgi:formate hydrogenlyase subunit 3/multisubunit Na+/H+ antiporter MnhD subunit